MIRDVDKNVSNLEITAEIVFHKGSILRAAILRGAPGKNVYFILMSSEVSLQRWFTKQQNKEKDF